MSVFRGGGKGGGEKEEKRRKNKKFIFDVNMYRFYVAPPP